MKVGKCRIVTFAVFFVMLSVFLLGEVSATGSDRIAFVRGGNIWIAHTNGSQERQLTFSGQDGSPSLSPDGKWVVYNSGKDRLTGFGHLYLMSTDGGAAKRFDIKGVHAAQDPSFSFDGNSFIFVGLSNVKAQGLGDMSRVHATVSISSVDLLNLKLRTIMTYPNALLETGYIYDAPSYSPDQTLVAFQHSAGDVSGGFEVVDLKGKPLFHYPKDFSDGTPYWRPRFSSDGMHILCYSPSISEATTDTVYLVDMKKGKKRKIVEGINPTFVDGGKAIVFEQGSNHGNPGGKSDLWYMKLGPVCGTPKKIISNASQPSD